LYSGRGVIEAGEELRGVFIPDGVVKFCSHGLSGSGVADSHKADWRAAGSCAPYSRRYSA
jgi:hypothetical protein